MLNNVALIKYISISNNQAYKPIHIAHLRVLRDTRDLRVILLYHQTIYTPSPVESWS